MAGPYLLKLNRKRPFLFSTEDVKKNYGIVLSLNSFPIDNIQAILNVLSGKIPVCVLSKEFLMKNYEQISDAVNSAVQNENIPGYRRNAFLKIINAVLRAPARGATMIKRPLSVQQPNP